MYYLTISSESLVSSNILNRFSHLQKMFQLFIQIIFNLYKKNFVIL